MRKNVAMIGSVPMALNEMQLAPAMISAVVQNRGHRFRYWDVNLELFQFYHCQKEQYLTAVELLQNIVDDPCDPVIDAWQRNILERLETFDLVVINVFSVLSQGSAWRFVRLIRSRWPDIKILLGGIGSHKKIFGSINEYNLGWISHTFPDHTSDVFGQLLLDNGWIDGWQPDVGTTVLESRLPWLPTTAQQKLLDFSDYHIDQYLWDYNQRSVPILGSHGCVRQCSFCDVIVHFPRYEFVAADQLSKNIVDVYNQTGIARIQFMDSLVNGSMSNFLALLKNLTHARQQGWLPENFAWSGTYICRPPSKQLKQIHQYLGPSGADNLIIGVESGSDRVRFEMAKKFTNQDLLAELEAFDQGRVKASLLFFPAWPTETAEDFAHTLNLFADLASWSHRGTVASLSLGTTGFSLTDNTPIDRNKQSIGLEAGPTPFLWRCRSNPELDYWQSLKRRRTMSKWAQALGMLLLDEPLSLHSLLFNLKTHRQVIEHWTGCWQPGVLDPDLDPDLWQQVSRSKIQLRFINSDSRPVVVSLTHSDQHWQWMVEPGIKEFAVEFDRRDRTPAQIQFQFRFHREHTPQLDKYDSGDYYSKNGLYIDLVQIDQRNITLSAFNLMFDQHWIDSVNLPNDYHDHCNIRAVLTDCDLIACVPANITLHEWISRCEQPELYREQDQLNAKLLQLT